MKTNKIKKIKIIELLVLMFFLSCSSKKSSEVCFLNYQVIHGKFKSFYSNYDKIFLNADKQAQITLEAILNENNCSNDFILLKYLKIDAKIVFILKNNRNKGMVLVYDGSVLKKIEFDSNEIYEFKGITADYLILKIFLKHNNIDEVLIIKDNSDFVLWNVYEF